MTAVRYSPEVQVQRFRSRPNPGMQHTSKKSPNRLSLNLSN